MVGLCKTSSLLIFRKVHKFLSTCINQFHQSSGFWEYGHQLFKSTPETFPVAFIPGDIFDPAFISETGPFLSMAEVNGTVMPPLNTLSSLNPVRGKISAIHASDLFHLFSEERQLQLAKIISSFLSPEKGSVIFGQHTARPIKGLRDEEKFNRVKMFCHSPESWAQMWIEVFGKEEKDGDNRVKVDAELVREVTKSFADYSEEYRWIMKWSVIRL